MRHKLRRFGARDGVMAETGGLALAAPQALVFLGATALFVPAFRRVGLSPVMAFLIIGLCLGPYGVGLLLQESPASGFLSIDPEGPASWLAELGVVFLLFAVGLEVSAERLWALRRLVLGFGAVQLVLCTSAIAVIATLLGAEPGLAIVTGLALSMSSTAVVLQLLGERRQIGGPVGRASFSALLLQDLAVIPILFALAALGDGQAPAGPGGLLSAVGGALAALAAIILAGRFLIRPLFRWAASGGGREVFVGASLLVVVGAAFAADAAGLSMALGAFLAGLLLAETEFRTEIETVIEPFKGLLMGLFFVTVGMQIDVPLAIGQPLLVALGVAGLFIVKALIIAPLARIFSLSWPNAVAAAFLTAQAGEFAFVVFAAGRSAGVVPSAAGDYLLLITALSIFFTPMVADLGAKVARRMERDGQQDLRPHADEEQSGHVVIAGYGRVGQSIGDILQQQQIPHVAVDLDAVAVRDLRNKGWPVHFGDASRREVMEALGAERAGAIVVTMDSAEAVEKIVVAARAAWPGIPVFARARDTAQARRLHLAGASFASPETTEATLQLGEALLGGIGLPDEAARRIIEERREQERLRTLAPS